MQSMREGPWDGVTVIGCPVYERGWVLDRWFDALAGWVPHLNVEFVFVYTPGEDDTLEIINARTLELDVPVHLIHQTEGTHSVQRNWGSAERSENDGDDAQPSPEVCAGAQTGLVFLVGFGHPGAFLDGGWELWEALTPRWHYSAVAPLAYLGSGSITNAYTVDKHRRVRAKVYDAVQPVNIICAAKLMSPNVFMDDRVNYGYHTHGEDLYWSSAATSYLHNLAFDTRVKCKHIMSPEDS